MKEILTKIWATLKAFRIHWVAIYAAFAFLVYIHFLGFLGAVAMTVLLVVFNGKIHSMDIPLPIK